MQCVTSCVTVRHLRIGPRLSACLGTGNATGGCRLGLGRISLIFGAALVLAVAAGQWNGAQASQAPVSLSCESAYKMGEWSLSKTASQKPASLVDGEFARKVLERYVELADPNHILLLQSEVDAFTTQAISDWNRFISKRQCGGFETWFNTHMAQGHARLARLLKAAPLEKTVPKKLAASVGDDQSFPIFRLFPKSEIEISQRLMVWAEALGASANQAQLDAFKGDRRALVEFSMERSLFPDGPTAPVHILARAYINTIDPFSDYFSETEYADFYRDLTGGTSGVGVRVRDVPTGLLVQKVIADSPAGKSKAIASGDTITHVDGKSLAGMDAQKMRHVLEGAEFTPVVLTLSRAGKPDRSLRLVRRSFAFEDERVDWKLVSLRGGSEKKAAVISIPSFYGRGGSAMVGERSSAEDVENALVQALKSKPSAVVLDMRGNPGGYLEEAVAMGGLFLGNRPIVAVVEPTMQRVMRDFHARAIYTGPLLVMVDEQSASAAEVLAGALKDYGRAVVLGAPRTYGKGSVQRLFHLDTGLVELAARDRQGVLKLTTSFFYSPLGKTPAAGGIEPHIRLSAKPRKDSFGPKRHQSAPPQQPFVDGATLSDIALQERLMQTRIAALKESVATRDDEMKILFDRAVKQAFGPVKAEEPERASLSETLAIADDLIGLSELDQHAASNPTASRDKKDAARVPGYGTL
jgi:C-terminal peptidase prc